MGCAGWLLLFAVLFCYFWAISGPIDWLMKLEGIPPATLAAAWRSISYPSCF